LSQDTDSVSVFQASHNLDDMVKPELREEWDRVKYTIFVRPGDKRDQREPGAASLCQSLAAADPSFQANGRRKPLAQVWWLCPARLPLIASGWRYAWASFQLYSIWNEETGASKVAARGGSLRPNRLLLNHAAFKAALARPLQFQHYLQSHGLRVVGFHLLAPLEEDEEAEEERKLDWAAVRRRLSAEGGAEERRRRLGQAALDWERAEEAHRLRLLKTPHDPHQPLALTNFSIRKAPHSNEMESVTTSKTILLAHYSKRVLVMDGTRTCPLPEPGES
jgi:hypothetical protein